MKDLFEYLISKENKRKVKSSRIWVVSPGNKDWDYMESYESPNYYIGDCYCWIVPEEDLEKILNDLKDLHTEFWKSNLSISQAESLLLSLSNSGIKEIWEIEKTNEFSHYYMNELKRELKK